MMTQTTQQLARKLGQLQSQLQRLPSAPLIEPGTLSEQERQKLEQQRQELTQLHTYTRRFAQDVLRDLSLYLDQ